MHLRADRETVITMQACRRGLVTGLVVVAAVALAACGTTPSPGATGTGAPAAHSSPVAPPTTPAPPLTLLSTTPASGSALAAPTTPVTFTFSAPLAALDSDQQVSPATPGVWTEQGASLTFTPSSQYTPYSPLTLTVPAGLRGLDRSVLAAPVVAHYTTPQPSTLRVQELLAELDYLPLSFTPTGAKTPLVATPPTTAPPTTAAPTTAPAPTAAPTTKAATTKAATGPAATGPAATVPAATVPTATGPSTPADPTPPATISATTTPATVALTTSTTAAPTTVPTEPLSAAEVPVAAQPGTFAWRWPSIPAGLGRAWGQGASDPITTGAIMAFEADHGLAVDGVAGPSVWTALTSAVAAGQVDKRAYDYISVSKALPEKLTVWQNGADVYSTLANTGVAGAPTAEGTFPVYERFVSTTMRGRNPDGSEYDDPGIPWVAYFNGGDAVHGFVRARYGYPQSDGCVELPPSHAEVVYPMDYYGTLVTVA